MNRLAREAVAAYIVLAILLALTLWLPGCTPTLRIDGQNMAPHGQCSFVPLPASEQDSLADCRQRYVDEVAKCQAVQ